MQPGASMVRGMIAEAHKLDGNGRREDSCAPDEALLAYLIGAIHSASAPLAASTCMAVFITVCAYQVTGVGIFLVQALAHVVIGLGRLSRVADYHALKRAGLTSADIARSDNAFAFWST